MGSKKELAKEDTYKISKNVSSKQKGDIAEARIAELVTLYGIPHTPAHYERAQV